MKLLQGLLDSIHDTFAEIGVSYFSCVILCFLIFWVVFRRKIAHLRIQHRTRIKSKVLFREIAYSFLTFIVIGIGGWILDPIIFEYRFGLFYDNIYTDVADFGWIYLVLTVFLMLLFDDTYFYWVHRLMHHPKLYDHVHKVHHYSSDPNPFTSYSLHPYEAVLLFLGQLLVISLIPVHPLAVSVWSLLSLLNTVLIHLGYEIFPPWFTQNWITRWKTPCTHHNMHHARGHGNYALIFIFWDKLMGTELPDYSITLAAIQKGKQNP